MKIRSQDCFLVIGIILLSTSVSLAQEKIRTFEISKPNYSNQPISIGSSEVGTKKISDDGTVLAGMDWVNNLRITVKNISSKNIVFIKIVLVVPKNDRLDKTIMYPVRFGLPVVIDDSGKEQFSDRRQVLPPNGSVVVSVSERDAKMMNNELRKTGSEDFDSVAFQLQEVQFDDDTGWTYGGEWLRDPTHRGRVLPLNAKPESQGFFRSVKRT